MTNDEPDETINYLLDFIEEQDTVYLSALEMVSDKKAKHKDRLAALQMAQASSYAKFQVLHTLPEYADAAPSISKLDG